MSLVKVHPNAVSALARSISITNHETGATTPWVPNIEQERCWLAFHEHAWVMVGKPRQVGLTTAAEFDDLIWCAANDAAGNRVRCGLYVDTDKKLSERVEFAKQVIKELPDIFKGCAVNSDRVSFPRGSVYEFGTGSGSAEGRAGSFQRLHLSELPFWKVQTTYTSLMPTLSLDGQVILETTFDTSAPCGPLAKKLWFDKSNRYHRVFLSVEMHLEYRADPSRIDSEQWSWCQSQGFTNRSAASWWLTVALPDICAGDVSRLLREYPQVPEHMFATSEGRVVPRNPDVIPPSSYLECGGQRVPCWRPLARTSEQLVVAVDTGKGVDRDRSAVVVIDKRDMAICACFVSATLSAFEFAKVVHDLLHRHYWRDDVVGQWNVMTKGCKPDLIVEENGIGEAMVLKLRELGSSVITKWTDEESKALGIEMARDGVLDGRLYGPQELLDDCESLHRDDHGNLKGKKDVLMALGFALLAARASPYKVVEQKVNRELVFDAKSILKSHMKPKRGGW